MLHHVDSASERKNRIVKSATVTEKSKSTGRLNQWTRKNDAVRPRVRVEQVVDERAVEEIRQF
jgi:hypothetical protein